ncbi:MAG: DHA2 family efflux MFS transporter permease subunit [Burkholderiales bacterium]|nr:DHA2 family efflux MFS transporter permease subunit [Burkholderiales bacterium]
MLATLMQVVDTTIANVALPHMQGTMGATLDQIAWVLTSYVVASAIGIPLTGYLATRFGRKRIFLWSVAGFTATSMLCGAAQSLEQIVLFRLLQGLFGAALVPLSQAVMLDTWPRERQVWAMALWGAGVTVGPIIGPSLGGWITEFYSWRWVFYLNLPVGIVSWLGMAAFLRETPPDRERRFDVLGFAFLAVGLGALQLMLDRGHSLDWFASPEIVLEAALSALCLYLFVAHILTHERPFIEPAIFADGNFRVGLLIIFMLGIVLLATLVLLPPFLQNLIGYPVVDVGNLLAPRGVGTMSAMFVASRIAGRLDGRALIFAGFSLMALSSWEMTHFTLDVAPWDIVRTGLMQGFGLGLVFAPLNFITFDSLAPRFRNDGTALYSLMRNVGASIGISLVVTNLARDVQANHAAFVPYLDPTRLALRQAVELGAVDLATTAGLVALNAEVTRQAATLAYLQDFRLTMWAALAALPLAFMLRSPRRVRRP